MEDVETGNASSQMDEHGRRQDEKQGSKWNDKRLERVSGRNSLPSEVIQSAMEGKGQGIKIFPCRKPTGKETKASFFLYSLLRIKDLGSLLIFQDLY